MESKRGGGRNEYGLRPLLFIHSLQRRFWFCDKNRLTPRWIHIRISDVFEFKRTETGSIEYETCIRVQGENFLHGLDFSALKLDTFAQSLREQPACINT